jgi:MFS family permease
MGTGFLLIGFGNGYVPVLAGLAITGLGTGLMFPNLNVWLTSGVPAAVRGRTVGGLTTAIFLGQFLSPFAGQPFVEKFGPGILFSGAGVLFLSFALVFSVFRSRILRFINPVNQKPVIDTTATS